MKHAWLTTALVCSSCLMLVLALFQCPLITEIILAFGTREEEMLSSVISALRRRLRQSRHRFCKSQCQRQEPPASLGNILRRSPCRPLISNIDDPITPPQVFVPLPRLALNPSKRLVRARTVEASSVRYGQTFASVGSLTLD
jgi:hypothetical protein